MFDQKDIVDKAVANSERVAADLVFWITIAHELYEALDNVETSVNILGCNKEKAAFIALEGKRKFIKRKYGRDEHKRI